MNTPRSHGDRRGSEPAQTKKRRRRILSCLVCRRMKCRCEFKDDADTCVRCHSLRLPCLKADDRDLFPSPDDRQQGLDVDQRLSSIENSISDIRSLLQGVLDGQRQGQQPQQDRHHQEPDNNDADDDGPRDIEPADQQVSISPAEVVRKVGSQLNGGYRRTFEAQSDLVTLGILDLQSARELLSQFIRRRRHTLFLTSESDLSSRGNLRHTSPFLHAVCCLDEMRHNRLAREDGAKHRLVYEHVRVQLGRVMLATPLGMEELMGILIMSLFSLSPSRGPEYLDSWLLSGHCAQHSMLSIRFSEILSRLNLGRSEPEDQRAIRLWANVCLVNLHWAATTGRPSVLPSSYLRQCRALLCFDQATMRDGMLYAEICLFTILHDLSCQSSAVGHDGTCKEISEWRQKWNHLFELPTSTILKLGYRIAWLVLVRRFLERLRTPQSDSRTSADRGDGAAAQDAQSMVYRHAVQVIEAFMAIPETDCANLPEFYLLSVAYSLLVLSKYETDPPSGSRDPGLTRLLEEVGERADRQAETMPMALQFGVDRALGRAKCAVGAGDVAMLSGPSPSAGTAFGGDTAVLPAEPGFDIQGGLGQQQGAAADVAIGSPFLEHASLEGMEFFFGGGYVY